VSFLPPRIVSVCWPSVADRNRPLKHVQRARIVLYSADRLPAQEVARRASVNRNAAHPVNAILNYAYGVLESDIRIKAISEGYDPTIGIMHEGRDGPSKFIFDLMEPERPKIDRAVLDFVKSHVFDPVDFVIRSDGVCRLNPEMARMVVARVST